ncbi:MAG: MarR family transcriptional regulator [Alphaproteobacteria bacterium]|nr:MarR family transcriptional regulator [Alphaproteobacteria bacterium]
MIDTDVQLAHFVEEMGLVFTEMGGSRMAGRVLGRLLICDPPHQSSAELAEALMASSGSISTVTRQLVQGGMIERIAVPGERATYFRIRPGMWAESVRVRMAMLSLMRGSAERGLELLASAPAARRRRLEEFRDFYAFMEEQTPALLEAWARKRAMEER